MVAGQESNASYKQKADTAIRNLILDFECQPILFVGSGLSRRYFDAPDWGELIRKIFMYLPDGNEEFEYNVQKFERNFVEIGSVLSNLIFEWAWKDGKSVFPEEMFSGSSEKSAFIKYLACKIISEVTPTISDIDKKFQSEIDSLKKIRPHAIITTNYDKFLDQVFDGYESVVGQTIFKYNTNSFGEIFHIHGSVDKFDSIVLTKNDYDEWSEKKKYVSAKLLTYFAEHPVFIIGYGLNDPNVKEIMRDIGLLVADHDGLIKNVFQIIWTDNKNQSELPDQAIFSFDNREYRTRAVYTNEWNWVFDALRSQSALTSVNPQLVRALAARTMKLIRHDIPSGNVAVNYDILERIADNESELPSLLGISAVKNTNESHPLILSQVAERLGFSSWHNANKLINQIKEEKGIDIRSSDNKYHERIKTGKSSTSYTRKWSLTFVELLKNVRDSKPYELKL